MRDGKTTDINLPLRARLTLVRAELEVLERLRLMGALSAGERFRYKVLLRHEHRLLKEMSEEERREAAPFN